MIFFPAACTITGWFIGAEGTSPTCTLDIWIIGAGTSLPTVANSITAAAKPALATGNFISSTTMTGWTGLSVTAGSIGMVNVDAVSAATKIYGGLKIN
jgi:Ca2+/Na+ antiporter